MVKFMKEKSTIAIIGGGAAGLMAAAYASEICDPATHLYPLHLALHLKMRLSARNTPVREGLSAGRTPPANSLWFGVKAVCLLFRCTGYPEYLHSDIKVLADYHSPKQP